MMEWWKNGIMESGNDGKMVDSFMKIIPLFQYSRVPIFSP